MSDTASAKRSPALRFSPVISKVSVTKTADFSTLSDNEKIIYLKDKISKTEAGINDLKQDAAVKRALDNIYMWKNQLRKLDTSLVNETIEDDDDMDAFEAIKYNAKLVATKRSNSLIVTGQSGVGKTMTVIKAIAFLNPAPVQEQIDDYTKQIEQDTIVEEKPQKEIKLFVPAKKAPPLKKVAKEKQPKTTIYTVPNVGYVVIRGTCTAAALYEILFIYRDKTLLFDDCDSVLKDDDCINYFKAALDTYPIREVSKMTSGNTFISAGMSDDEIQDRYEQDGKLPKQFNFTGNIIFVSNIHEEDFDKALISRSLHVEVRLSKEQIIERMYHLITDIRTEVGNDIKIEALKYLEYLTTHYPPSQLKFDLDLRGLIHAIDYRSGFPPEDPENKLELKSGKEVFIWQQLVKKRLLKSKIHY